MKNGGIAKYRMQVILLVLGILIIYSVLYVFFQDRSRPIKIGAILSLTGPTGAVLIGEQLRNGLQMAVDEINALEGINGRSVELVIEDSESNAGQGREAFERLEKNHQPLFYISTLSSVSNALAPLVEKEKVVLMGLVVTAQEFTAKKEWVFRYWPTATDEISPLVLLVEKLNIHSIGINYLNDPYGDSIFRLAKREFEKIGVRAQGVTFELGEKTFSSQIQRLSENEAIYSIGYPGHLQNVCKRLKETDYKGLILAINGVSLPSLRQQAQFENVYTTAPIIYNDNYTFARDSRRKYEDRFGRQFNHFTAVGYDFIRLITGLINDEIISREDVKLLLKEGFIYPGIFGQIKVEPGQHDISFPLHPARIVDGDVEYLQ